MDRFDMPNTKRTLTGLWIGFLYITCMFLVIYSLSTYQFQLGLNLIPQSNPNTSAELVDHVCNISVLKSKSINKSKNIIKIPCIPNNAQISSGFYSAGEIFTLYKKYKNDISKLKGQVTALENKIAEMKDKLKNMKDEKITAEFIEEIKLTEGNMFGAIRELEEIKEMKTQKNLIETFSDIEYFDSLFATFWALPKQILTIILISSMGILGSLIFVTIEFIKDVECHTNMRCCMYIFRPFLGMIVALAMYVMVKSGQSTFTDTSAEMLSPFLISFLGIISGMLAEQAYKRLVITGTSVINGSNVQNNESIKP